MPDRFQNIDIFLTKENVRYYTNPIYPEIPLHEDDIYVITAGGDRYDTLAQQFYGNSSYWWIIASANVSKTDSLSVQPGVQLRIPHEPGTAINLLTI